MTSDYEAKKVVIVAVLWHGVQIKSYKEIVYAINSQR